MVHVSLQQGGHVPFVQGGRHRQQRSAAAALGGGRLGERHAACSAVATEPRPTLGSNCQVKPARAAPSPSNPWPTIQSTAAFTASGCRQRAERSEGRDDIRRRQWCQRRQRCNCVLASPRGDCLRAACMHGWGGQGKATAQRRGQASELRPSGRLRPQLDPSCAGLLLPPNPAACLTCRRAGRRWQPHTQRASCWDATAGSRRRSCNVMAGGERRRRRRDTPKGCRGHGSPTAQGGPEPMHAAGGRPEREGQRRPPLQAAREASLGAGGGLGRGPQVGHPRAAAIAARGGRWTPPPALPTPTAHRLHACSAALHAHGGAPLGHGRCCHCPIELRTNCSRRRRSAPQVQRCRRCPLRPTDRPTGHAGSQPGARAWQQGRSEEPRVFPAIVWGLLRPPRLPLGRLGR